MLKQERQSEHFRFLLCQSMQCCVGKANCIFKLKTTIPSKENWCLFENGHLTTRGGGGGGHSSEFLVGVCCPVLQILTQFQTKIFHFQHPFSDLASKAIFTRDRSQMDPTQSWNGPFLFTRYRSAYQRLSTRDRSVIVRY